MSVVVGIVVVIARLVATTKVCDEGSTLEEFGGDGALSRGLETTGSLGGERGAEALHRGLGVLELVVELGVVGLESVDPGLETPVGQQLELRVQELSFEVALAVLEQRIGLVEARQRVHHCRRQQDFFSS